MLAAMTKTLRASLSLLLALAAAEPGVAAPTEALAGRGDPAIRDAKEDAGRWLGQWTLKTADTTLTIGVRSDQQLCLCRLASPADWNWTRVPSPFPLVSRADIGGEQRELGWGFKEGAEDQAGGSRVTLTFTNADPALELTSVWQARGGPGPVRHTMFIKNRAAREVTLYEQESLDVQVAGPGADTSVWYINDDGSLPDKTGVYHDPLAAGYQKLLRFSEDQDYIPFTIVDAHGSQGVYIGWEWSIGRISIAAQGPPGAAAIKAGSGDNFRTDLEPGETFEVPPGFIGAYQGDLDEAGNSLRKYLFNYSMPAILRDDPSYPKVEWNAFAATGKGQGSWVSTETKYYPLVDEIAQLGFEEVVLDIGWWQGDTTHKPHPPVGSVADWPSGMLAARNYAHDRGMRFGMYWNCNPSMTTLDGIKHRQADAQYLFDRFHIDFFRSDGTDGNVLQTGGHGSGARAHYAEDAGYWQTKGYYQVLDSLYASITNFSYENCSGGGRIKDYGILKRCMKIQNQDRYYPLDARQSFYDSSFALHPMQIAALCGSWAEWQASGSVYEFRSSSMGAAYWHPDAPNGHNGGPVWTSAQRARIKDAVNTYKTLIRPLVRTANLYHIFPRPTGTIWDGIEYFDPVSRRGAVYVFRPDSPEATHTMRLKGLEPQARYRLWCADGSFSPMQMGGQSLMQTGLTLGLAQRNTSEIVFLEDATSGRPEDTHFSLEYAPGPADNPLKGLVPYASSGGDSFPHSMEFSYFPLSALVTGYDLYDWTPLDKFLNEAAGRGHQAVFRVFLEWPGRPGAIPAFLVKDGLKVYKFKDLSVEPAQNNETPDYADPKLRTVLLRFITALGRRYDGDPRIGFITAGLLGGWGEWHGMAPRYDLFAGKDLQLAVMDAYEAAFATTRILLRYPTGGEGFQQLAPNAKRRFGYHDDSFAWGTLDTGKPGDYWFFLTAQRMAGREALDKWKTQPIGGEIRPEAWGIVFDPNPARKEIQNFHECVDATHVSWLMDSGMFRQQPNAGRSRRAEEEVRRMGYDFYVAGVTLAPAKDGRLPLKLELVNRGTAPFYYDWPMEFGLIGAGGRVLMTSAGSGKITGLLPGDDPRIWDETLSVDGVAAGKYKLALRVRNKLPTGHPIRFANKTQDADVPGWLTLGEILLK